MEQGQRRFGALIWGLVFIIGGILLYLTNTGYLGINLGQLWPIFPTVFGFILLAYGVFNRNAGRRDEGAIMVGLWGLLIGLFFFLFSTGTVAWGEMGRLWPTFPLIGGVGFLAAFLSGGLRDWGILIVGGIALAVGVIGYLFTYGVLGGALAAFILPYLTPALLILIGLAIIISGLTRRRA